MELNVKKGVLICCISRKGKIITPSGSDTIEIGDRVVILHTKANIKNIDDIVSL